MTRVTADDLAALIQIFDASDWQEMHLTAGDTDLFLSRDPQAAAPGHAAARAAPQAAPEPPQAEPQAAPGALPSGLAAIRAPSLGTFYRAPKPGAPPFVAPGQAVSAETEVCLIEVMKLFTAVRAGVSGVIREVCVSDGELVEYDRTLFLVAPDA